MHRIDRCFAELERAGKKALCVYLCIGDPLLEESMELALAALDAGADLLELGVPFSDPTADGPVLARASRRALEAGATIERVIDVARRVRERADAPLVLFTYYNPVFVTGEQRVVNLASEAGIDALLVVDLPPEEAGGLRSACAERGLGLVPLVTPTTDATRLEVIRRLSQVPEGAPRAFVYAVSMTGVTGALPADVSAMGRSASMFHRTFGRPVLVGFGIDGAQSARAAAGSDGAGPEGIVVGTAIVRQLEQGISRAERVRFMRSFVYELRDALDG